MRHLYAYDHRGRLERWLVVWTDESASLVIGRWRREGLTVKEGEDNE